MKNFKDKLIRAIVPVGLSILILVSIAGCSSQNEVKNNDEVHKQEEKNDNEEVRFQIIENTIIPDFLKEKYKKEKELQKDYKTFKTILLNLEDESVSQEEKDAFSKKYGFDKLNGAVDIVDLYNCSPEFYEGFSTYFIMFTVPTNVLNNMIDDAQLQIQNYLKDTLTDEENNDYILANEFKELNPKETVKKYLSDNEIEITNIVYPEKYEAFESQAVGGLVVTVNVGIEGTIKDKSFRGTIPYDFHFVSSDNERHGKSNIGSTQRFEIMGVTPSYLNKDKETYDFSDFGDKLTAEMDTTIDEESDIDYSNMSDEEFLEELKKETKTIDVKKVDDEEGQELTPESIQKHKDDVKKYDFEVSQETMDSWDNPKDIDEIGLTDEELERINNEANAEWEN